MSDLIERQAAIDSFNADDDGSLWSMDDIVYRLEQMPSVQPEDWMERNKERITQAGMEGREIEFRIGGRLFAIREKAQ